MSRVSGDSLLRKFDSNITDLENSIQAIDQDIAACERTIADANASREAAYSELASTYCDKKDELRAELSAVNRDLQRIFDNKAERRRALEADIVQYQDLILKSRKDAAAARTERNEAAKALQEATERVQAELEKDAEYKQLLADQDAAKAIAGKADATKNAIDLETTEKLKAFEGDKIFTYLVDRKFGTPEYSGRGVIAKGDAWLAKLVDWDKNYPNYCILNQLPNFCITARAERNRTAEAATARVNLRIQKAEQAQGAAEAKVRHDRRCASVTSIESTIEGQEANLQALTDERRTLESGKDPFVIEAKNAIKNMLNSESITALRERARRTADPRDDKLVDIIEGSENAVNEGRASIKKLRASRKELTDQKTRAKEARSKFNSEYTGSYDRFDSSLDVNNLLVGYMLGKTTSDSFWTSIDRHHHDETPAPSYSSSSSSSSYGFGGGSSGGSSSGFSFGGGSSGGGCSFGGGD